jgi:peptidoglycan LD-endopeptidase CwlK
MSTKISDLVPEVSAVAQRCVNALITAGIPHAVTSTLRTVEEQAALYAQGRLPLDRVNDLRKAAGLYAIGAEDNTYTVTNADGVTNKSNHQSGRALDVVPLNTQGSPVWPDHSDPRWKQISDIFKSQGFAWGGDWTSFPDYPHYEMV